MKKAPKDYSALKAENKYLRESLRKIALRTFQYDDPNWCQRVANTALYTVDDEDLYG